MNNVRERKPDKGSYLRMGRGHGPGGVGMPVEKAKDFTGTVKRLLTYLKPRRFKITLVFFMAIFSTIFSIVSPKIMGKTTTEFFRFTMLKMQGITEAAINFPYILNIIILLGILYIFSAFFAYFQQFIMAGVTQNIVFDMRNDLSSKLSRLPLKYFDTRAHGDILSRVTNDIDNIATTLQQSLTQLITSVVTLIGIVAMMLTISPLLTLIAAITLPLSFLVTKKIVGHSQKYFAAQQKALGKLNGHVEEIYAGHEVIKIFGREQQSLEKFQNINDELYGSAWKAQFVSGIIMPLMTLINNLGYVFICIVGGIMVTRRAIEIGDVQAFIVYSKQFTHPIIQTANIANIIQSTVASAERVFEILDEAEETPDPENAGTINNPRGEVKLEKVSFGYAADHNVIQDINIHVKPGQKVAVVGPTGAGKTTLVNLLMRFYELGEGRIIIDGVNIKELSRNNLRSMFGMVLQDTWLFNGTIRDNIAYGRSDATEEDIVKAAEAARADHFIRTLPEGYDTFLNEEASNISQGQKQLLTIARAILADPEILILDEATSSVDTRTEIFIQKAMTELMKGRTSFVIAHRLSTIRDADLILVIDNGKIIEHGRHQDLLANNGFYAELYNSQFLGKNNISPAAESI